jgi:hypothetical protein
MHRIGCAFTVGMLMSTIGWLPSAAIAEALAEKPHLTVLDTGSDPTRLHEISIAVAAGATEGSNVVNIRNDGSDEVTFGLQAIVADLSSSVTAATGPATDRFTLKSHEVVAVKVGVTGVTDNASHEGELLVGADGEGLSQLIPVKVSRSAAPTDLLVEGSTAAGIERTVSTAEIRDTITLLSPGQRPITVSLRVTDLIGPDGETYPLDATHAGTNAETDFTVTVPYDITLRGRLPRPGAYHATMTMTVGGRLLSTAIEVTRTPEALALTLTEPIVPSVQAAGRASTTLTMVVTSVAPVSLRQPKIHVKLGGDDEAFDAEISVDGRLIAPAETILLASDVATTVSITIRGLKDAGAYTGTVSFYADGLSGSAEKAFAFGVRRPPMFALGIIALGVVLSLVVSGVLVKRKQNLLSTVAAIPFSADLDALGQLQLEPQDAALRETLRGRLDDARARSDAATTPDEHAYDGVSVRLKLLRRVVLVQSRMALAGEITRATAASSLATVRGFIASADGDSVPPDVDQAIKDAEEMTGVLPGLRDQVADIRRRLDGRAPMFDAEKVKDIRLDLEARLGSAPTASNYAQAIERSRPDLIDLYQTTLEQQASAVPAHPPADWSNRQAAVLAEARKIDRTRGLAEADAHLDAGYGLLLVALIDGLASVATSEQVKKLLDDAAASVHRGALLPAKASYDEAVKKHNADQAALAEQAAKKGIDGPLGAGNAGGGGAPAGPATGAPAYNTPSPDAPATTADVPASATKRLANELKWIRLATAVVIGLVATVVGFGLLYVDSPTWGSAKDAVAAFVWGLGLSGTSYAGAAAVSSTLSGAKPGA